MNGMNEMNDDGRLIDDALRNVPLPPAWPAGLRPEAVFADDELDRLLAAVAVPADLAPRIRAGLEAQPTRRRDGTVDLERLRGDAAGLRLQGPGSNRAERAGRWSLELPRLAREAASVAMALGLAGLLAVAGIEFSRRLEMPQRAGNGGPVAAAGKQPAALLPGAQTEAVPARPAGGQSVDPGLDGEGSRGLVAATTPPVSPAPAANRAPPPPAASAADEAAGLFATAEPEPGEPLVVRGAAVWPDDLAASPGPPALATVEIPSASWRRVPRVAGYDLAFEMTYGEQPFIDPAASDRLAVDRPPLSLATTSYEAFLAGRPRGRGKLRAEEVLAAIPAAGIPTAATEPVRLSIHAVRSWPAAGEGSSVFVEVAASAGRLERSAAAPLELTLVLDQAAAGDPGAWPRICRGLAAVAANLAPADRVTVVLSGPRARVAARDVDAGQLATLAADLEWQPAAASSDLDAGLALAGLSGRVVVVAHAVSLERVRGEAREPLTAWQAALAEAGGDTLAARPAGGRRFVILDAAALSPESRGEPTFGRTSSDAVSIRRALLRQATGQDTLVAADCELEVRFDPRQVARYRLIGHRQSAVQSLATTAPGSIDLHAGETVRAVYEVVPRKRVAPEALVTAAISWQAAGDGRQRLEARGLATADDLAAALPSPHGCELLLAVAVGELAAGSAHLERPAARVAAVESLLEAWRSRGDLTPFAAALATGFEQPRSGRRLAW
jgi:hypothetical protein